MMMMTKETETTTFAPSVPRDDHMSNENNDQHEAKNVDNHASVYATQPVPGVGDAMTLEQYSDLAKQRACRVGTPKTKQKQTRRIKINKINYLEDGGRARATSATVT